MSAPYSVALEPDPEWSPDARLRSRRRAVSAIETLPRGRGRIVLAYFGLLWLLEPEAIGTLVTDVAESVVGGFGNVVVAANTELIEATHHVVALQMFVDKFGP